MAPSKRPVAEANKVLERWREMGYKIALWLDAGDDHVGRICDKFRSGPAYPGYAVACNALIKAVLELDQQCNWVVVAGDDILPDPNVPPNEIDAECRAHFTVIDMPIGNGKSTFGVMQPTGDRWGDRQGAYIDRVAGSAFLGREFCLRINQGKGPIWPDYTHMGEDEELQAVAERYGVFWQRRDLIHFHNHWGRGPEGNPNAPQDRATAMPDFLKHANSKPEWDKYKAIFESRKRLGFPGSEPLS